MLSFLWGVSASSSLIAALFFLRFWRDTQDRLFAAFSAAFGVLSLNYAGLAVFPATDESRHLTYLIRLLAFVMILAGIVDKNLRAKH